MSILDRYRCHNSAMAREIQQLEDEHAIALKQIEVLQSDLAMASMKIIDLIAEVAWLKDGGEEPM